MTDNFAGATFEDTGESLVIDLNEIADQEFTVIPKGYYNATVEECTFGISKNSGAPMWTVKFNVDSSEYPNRKLFSWISFSEKALPGSKTTLKKIAPELFSGVLDLKEHASVLVGKPVRLEVAVEKYEGNDVNRVKKILAPSAEAGLGF